MQRKRGLIALVFVLLVVCMALTAALFLRELELTSGLRIQAESGTYLVAPGEAPTAMTAMTGNKRLFSGLRASE